MMYDREFRNSVQLFELVLTNMHQIAFDMSFTDENPVINEELIANGKTCVISWLCDEEFKSGLIKNPTSYYFGVAVNLMVCGMYYADCWANDRKLSELNYTDIYDGGLWNNVYNLLEDATDDSKNKFQILARELYDIWTLHTKPYLKLSNAGEYIVDTMVAFFQTGVDIKLKLLDK